MLTQELVAFVPAVCSHMVSPAPRGQAVITGSVLRENISAMSHQPSIVASSPAAPSTSTRAKREIRTERTMISQGNISPQATSRIFAG